MKKIKKVFNFLFVTTKAGFFLLAALLWSLVMCFVNNYYQIAWKEIFIEADGMVFDLIVFGVVLTIYEAFREIKENNERVLKEKNERIGRLMDEIEDFREWHEKEARFRIVGAMKRLVMEGVKKMNLRNCFLEGTTFGNWDLSETHFDNAILHDVKFHGTTLVNSTFQEAKLKNAAFHSVDLTGADLSGANLDGVDFLMTNLSHVNLEGSIVLPLYVSIVGEIGQKKYPYGCDDWFRKLKKDGAIGLEEIENKYYVDEFGILQLK